MWSILGWLLQTVVGLASLAATSTPLVAVIVRANDRTDIWGLDYKIWMLVGLSVFAVSMFSIVLRAILMYRKAVGPEAKLCRRKLELEVQELEAKWKVDPMTKQF